ncbi:hypothetical protein D3C71_1030730 [compost metagenome]
MSLGKQCGQSRFREYRIQRGRRRLAVSQGVQHQAVGAVVLPLYRHLQRERNDPADDVLTVQQLVELAVAGHDLGTVVGTVFVVGDDPDDARAALQAHLDRTEQRFLEVGIGERAAAFARHLQARHRLAKPRVVSWSAIHPLRRGMGGVGLVERAHHDLALTSRRLGQLRDKRLERRLGIDVERLHPAGVLHQDRLPQLGGPDGRADATGQQHRDAQQTLQHGPGHCGRLQRSRVPRASTHSHSASS